jgi:hypothetical protein
VIVFALPPFMMDYAQKQYVERTEESARELQRMNQELTRANQEIVGANKSIKELSDGVPSVGKIIDARDPLFSHTESRGYAIAIADRLACRARESIDRRHAATLARSVSQANPA